MWPDITVATEPYRQVTSTRLIKRGNRTGSAIHYTLVVRCREEEHRSLGLERIRPARLALR
jgi:hypothetical protein